MFFLSTIPAKEANWWEPATPGLLDIGDISVFLGALIAFSTVSMMISRWWMKSLRRVVKEVIEVATEPIQPTSNGGLSLADVARRTERLETHMLKLETQNDETKELLSTIIANFVKASSKTTRSKKAV